MSDEQQRINVFSKMRSQLLDDGYDEHQLCFTRCSQIVISVIFSVFAFMTAIKICGSSQFSSYLYSRKFATLIALPAIVLAFIYLHEYLHAFGWSIVLKGGWSSVSVRLGRITRKPFVILRESMGIGAYITGLLMPMLLTVAIPLISGSMRGGMFMFVAGICAVPVCSDDFIILLNVLRLSVGSEKIRILIYPEKYGCILYRKSISRPD